MHLFLTFAAWLMRNGYPMGSYLVLLSQSEAKTRFEKMESSEGSASNDSALWFPCFSSQKLG
jgi:hypothetical protein